MASNFSANQYEKEFKSRSLCNWEVPHWYPKRPRRRTATTKFIANEHGHLLPDVARPKSCPWGRFRNTWQLPAIITREMANEINAPPIGCSRWAVPDPNRPCARGIQCEIKKELEEPLDLCKSIEKKKVRTVSEPKPEPKESPKREFSEKEKLNNPLAIANQGKRAIRHETLERDHDEH